MAPQTGLYGKWKLREFSVLETREILLSIFTVSKYFKEILQNLQENLSGITENFAYMFFTVFSPFPPTPSPAWQLNA